MASRTIRRRLAILALAASLALTRGVLAEDPSVEELKRDLQAMKAQMRQMQETIRKQDEAIDRLTKASKSPAARPEPAVVAAQPAPSPAPFDEERLKDEVAARIAREMQPRLASLNKTFPSQFNPAIGLIIDNAFSSKTHERANFEFRSAELGLSADAADDVSDGSPSLSLASIFGRSSGSGLRSLACDHWKCASRVRPTRQ